MQAGFLNILKPPGMTSHDVVYRVRRFFPKGTKVGHLGTLDPPAAGVLPIAVGFATRLISHLPDEKKAYLAEIHFGWRSDTLDAAGVVEAGGPVPQELDLAPHLLPFQGTILQRPPQVSALRQDGQRSYDRARRGERFELPARPAIYHGVQLVRQTRDTATLRVACGPGTYIRSLARDLGESLGCGAILRFLLRLQSGAFHLPDAIRLEEISPQQLLPWHWPWRGQSARHLEHWPPPNQVEGWQGLAFHAKGAALYRDGVKIWAREGVAGGTSA
ncbi:MAG: tRNA pseudouridine(55) synthase TruB [Candidatus Eremiobacteraeota bacterium]|nr:tRNA pseudouridine(55) synthase TruB [Candidatus Eremiobacteraeota bacterium]MCW5871353.1 tRNA pseudouridine(55) synthase TruB [Candidatus Eremiobacteraeota bacterium]